MGGFGERPPQPPPSLRVPVVVCLLCRSSQSVSLLSVNWSLWNETEAGHARAKAEADIALSLPAEYRD